MDKNYITREGAEKNTKESLEKVLPKGIIEYVSNKIEEAAKRSSTYTFFTVYDIDNISRKWDSEHINMDERWNLHDLTGITYYTGENIGYVEFLCFCKKITTTVDRERIDTFVDRFDKRVEVIKAIAYWAEKQGFDVTINGGCDYYVTIKWDSPCEALNNFRG